MKKITICLLLTAMAHFSFSQQTSTTTSKVETDYLKKSKKQKKIGWILIGSGAAMFVVSAIIPEGELTDEINYTCLCKNIHENDGIKGGFIVVGALSMLGSIPFFIASGKNKKRAASISFINERITQLVKSSFVYRSIPSLNLKISL